MVLRIPRVVVAPVSALSTTIVNRTGTLSSLSVDGVGDGFRGGGSTRVPMPEVMPSMSSLLPPVGLKGLAAGESGGETLGVEGGMGEGGKEDRGVELMLFWEEVWTVVMELMERNEDDDVERWEMLLLERQGETGGEGCSWGS